MSFSVKHNQDIEVKRSKNDLALNGKLLTLSNFLSLLRVILFIPFVYFYEQNDRLSAFAILLFAVSTDWLDGKVARWTNTVSDLGKILDPLADKLSAGLGCIYLLYRGELPLWFVALIVSRDLIIFIGGIYAQKEKKVITTSLPTGKWAVFFLAIALGGTVFPFQNSDLQFAVTITTYIAASLFVISFLQYAKRFFDLLQDKPVTNL